MNKIFSRNIIRAKHLILNPGNHPFNYQRRFLAAVPKVSSRQATFDSDNLAKNALQRRLETGRTIDIIREELPLFLGPPFQFPKRILSHCSPNVTFYYNRRGVNNDDSSSSSSKYSNDYKTPLKLVLKGKSQLVYGVKFLSALQTAILDQQSSSFRLSHCHFVDIGLQGVSVTRTRQNPTLFVNDGKSSFYLMRFIYEPRLKGLASPPPTSILNQRKEAQLIFEFADWRDNQSCPGQIKRIIYETHSIPLLQLLHDRTMTFLSHSATQKPSTCCVKDMK